MIKMVLFCNSFKSFMGIGICTCIRIFQFLWFKGQPFSGMDHKVYLLGNPILWWLNLVVLVLFCLLYCWNAVRKQRGCITDPEVQGKIVNRHAKAGWSFHLKIAFEVHYLNKVEISSPVHRAVRCITKIEVEISSSIHRGKYNMFQIIYQWMNDIFITLYMYIFRIPWQDIWSLWLVVARLGITLHTILEHGKGSLLPSLLPCCHVQLHTHRSDIIILHKVKIK